MTTSGSHEVIILGLTTDGKRFRPSDWAERLAGVMSQFHPGSSARLGAHLLYSPWCTPNLFDGVKCVIVHRDLQAYDQRAWDFVMGFARDNRLQVLDPNSPDPSPPASP